MCAGTQRDLLQRRLECQSDREESTVYVLLPSTAAVCRLFQLQFAEQRSVRK